MKLIIGRKIMDTSEAVAGASEAGASEAGASEAGASEAVAGASEAGAGASEAVASAIKAGASASEKQNESPLAPIKLLKQYIRALITNIKRETIPPHMNLIFDSGAVNGVIGIGAAVYLSVLEEMGYFEIKKISGCSIGSLIAVWYIHGCPEELYGYANKLFTHYKTNRNFYMYESIVKELIYRLMPTEDMKTVNDRLYINYYDTKKCKNPVITHFKNRNHLISCILRSSHVPFLTSNQHKCEGRYVDGIVPHIFKDNKHPNLFIKLINCTDPLDCMKTKTEQNIYTRLLRGTMGVNDFFVNGNSHLCSYVTPTSYVTLIDLYLRKQIILLILCLIEWTIIIKNRIPLSIQETILYNKLIQLSKSCWNCLQNRLV